MSNQHSERQINSSLNDIMEALDQVLKKEPPEVQHTVRSVLARAFDIMLPDSHV